MTNKLYIKNMVCDRCKAAVKNELIKNKIAYKDIDLGEVELNTLPSNQQLEDFKTAIEHLGFELIEDKVARIVNKIKSNILTWIRSGEEQHKKLKFSIYLSDQLGKDYNYLSSLFSSIENTTIEQYLIHQKIERVKELLVYDELTLSEIASRLNYSSVQHLSNQFKKVTGLTPSDVKKIGHIKRNPLDKI
jgi:AraC family transcriptional regulator